MTASVQHLIESFDGLSDADKHQAVIEILRRFGCTGDLADATLVETADELFRALDAEEANHASR